VRVFNNNAFLLSYITYGCKVYCAAVEKSRFYLAGGVVGICRASENIPDWCAEEIDFDCSSG